MRVANHTRAEKQNYTSQLIGLTEVPAHFEHMTAGPLVSCSNNICGIIRLHLSAKLVVPELSPALCFL